ncbi:MAG: hypothetical protein ACFE0J_02300 [Elainellaceae cyanobacterium]
MEFWEFLIQKEGDRSWLPLEAPESEILEGRYRVIARSSRTNVPVEIQVSHLDIESSSPKRRVHTRSSLTNPDGLMVVIPFTLLKPGLLELRCTSDLMSEMMGDSWQYSVKLQVLSQHSETDLIELWDPDPSDRIHDVSTVLSADSNSNAEQNTERQEIVSNQADLADASASSLPEDDITASDRAESASAAETQPDLSASSEAAIASEPSPTETLGASLEAAHDPYVSTSENSSDDALPDNLLDELERELSQPIDEETAVDDIDDLMAAFETLHDPQPSPDTEAIQADDPDRSLTQDDADLLFGHEFATDDDLADDLSAPSATHVSGEGGQSDDASAEEPDALDSHESSPPDTELFDADFPETDLSIEDDIDALTQALDQVDESFAINPDAIAHLSHDALSSAEMGNLDQIASEMSQLFSVAEHMAEQVIASMAETFDQLTADAELAAVDDDAPFEDSHNALVDGEGTISLDITLDQETYSIQRGQPLHLSGVVNGMHEGADSLDGAPLMLRVRLTNPQNADVLSETDYPLDVQSLPSAFACLVDSLDSSQTHLIVGQIFLLRSTGAETPEILTNGVPSNRAIASQSFNITIDLEELLDVVQQPPVESPFEEETSPAASPLDSESSRPSIEKSEPTPGDGVPASDDEAQFRDSTPDEAPLLPPQLRHPHSQRERPKSPELPSFAHNPPPAHQHESALQAIQNYQAANLRRDDTASEPSADLFEDENLTEPILLGNESDEPASPSDEEIVDDFEMPEFLAGLEDDIATAGETERPEIASTHPVVESREADEDEIFSNPFIAESNPTYSHPVDEKTSDENVYENERFSDLSTDDSGVHNLSDDAYDEAYDEATLPQSTAEDDNYEAFFDDETADGDEADYQAIFDENVPEPEMDPFEIDPFLYSNGDADSSQDVDDSLAFTEASNGSLASTELSDSSEASSAEFSESSAEFSESSTGEPSSPSSIEVSQSPAPSSDDSSRPTGSKAAEIMPEWYSDGPYCLLPGAESTSYGASEWALQTLARRQGILPESADASVADGGTDRVLADVSDAESTEPRSPGADGNLDSDLDSDPDSDINDWDALVADSSDSSIVLRNPESVSDSELSVSDTDEGSLDLAESEYDSFGMLDLQDRFISRLSALASDQEWAEDDTSPVSMDSSADADAARWEVVVDDEQPAYQLGAGVHPYGVSTLAGAAPIAKDTSDSRGVFDVKDLPSPELELPDGELIAGQPISITVKLVETSSRFYVKLWIHDCQTRTMVDGPRWLVDLTSNGQGEVEASTQLTVPFGCLEIQFEAIAIEMATQRESHKTIAVRAVVPPDLPSYSFDSSAFDVFDEID